MSTLVSTTCAKDGTIRTYRLDGDSLQPLATSQVGDGVSALAPDASGRRAWAGTKQPQGIATLRLDPATGSWERVGHTPTDDSMTYLAVTGDQRFLLGASYGGGFGMVWPLDGQQVLEPTSRVEFDNLHCVVERDGFVYFVSLGEDLVACYRLTGDGVLEPLEVPTVDAPATSGPRHATFSPDGRTLYVVTEFSGEVLRFARDTATGTLELVQVVAAHATDRGLRHSVMGEDPLEHHYVWGADLHLAGERGQWLLASERTESTLAVLPVGPDGELGEMAGLVEVARQPRGFVVAPDRRRVLVSGEKATTLQLWQVGDDPTPTLLDEAPTGSGANWVRVVED